MTKYEPHEVVRYIADQPEQNRAELTRITAILADVFETQPMISYQIIGFKSGKHYLLYLSGWKDHLSFHGQNTGLGQEFCERYPQWFRLKGTTMHFQPTPQLPEEIIRELAARRLELLH